MTLRDWPSLVFPIDGGFDSITTPSRGKSRYYPVLKHLTLEIEKSVKQAAFDRPTDRSFAIFFRSSCASSRRRPAAASTVVVPRLLLARTRNHHHPRTPASPRFLEVFACCPRLPLLAAAGRLMTNSRSSGRKRATWSSGGRTLAGSIPRAFIRVRVWRMMCVWRVILCVCACRRQ
jgi:hypothetical protein